MCKEETNESVAMWPFEGAYRTLTAVELWEAYTQFNQRSYGSKDA